MNFWNNSWRKLKMELVNHFPKDLLYDLPHIKRINFRKTAKGISIQIAEDVFFGNSLGNFWINSLGNSFGNFSQTVPLEIQKLSIEISEGISMEVVEEIFKECVEGISMRFAKEIPETVSNGITEEISISKAWLKNWKCHGLC